MQLRSCGKCVPRAPCSAWWGEVLSESQGNLSCQLPQCGRWSPIELLTRSTIIFFFLGHIHGPRVVVCVFPARCWGRTAPQVSLQVGLLDRVLMCQRLQGKSRCCLIEFTSWDKRAKKFSFPHFLLVNQKLGVLRWPFAKRPASNIYTGPGRIALRAQEGSCFTFI